jgi:hypothetical protein
MRSHQWKPGNTYGGVPNATYAVLSYTWGKWRIRDPKSQVTALAVSGIPWNIPKVDPAHFTAEQFKYVLQQIIDDPRNAATPEKESKSSEKKTYFVWLDVACLSQFEDSPTGASEIGRQARIFRNATNAYVWLSTANSYELSALFSRNFDPTFSEAKGDLTAFCKLLSDPWFDSLWAMQEAFLRQTAYIITSSGFCHLQNEGEHVLNLSRIRRAALNYSSGVEKFRHQLLLKAEREFLKFAELWSRTGLQGSPRGISPMQVMACTSYRKCEFELERVYGIMQIFGDKFRVGKTRPGNQADSSGKYTLSKFQDELGGLILRHHPTPSQLFLHQEPPQAGRAWRICERAEVPSFLAVEAYDSFDASHVKKHVEYSLTPRSSLGTKAVGDIFWGTFEGKLCLLRRILDCSKASSFSAGANRFHVYLDAGTTFDAWRPPSGRSGPTPGDLLEHFGKDNLLVLLLSTSRRTDKDRFNENMWYYSNAVLLTSPGSASLAEHRRRKNWHFSLESTGGGAWARVGIVHWQWRERPLETAPVRTLEMNTLLGDSKDWKVNSGLWG